MSKTTMIAFSNSSKVLCVLLALSAASCAVNGEEADQIDEPTANGAALPADVAGAAAKNQAKLRTMNEPIEDQYIVVFKDDLFPVTGDGSRPTRTVAAMAAQMATTHGFEIGHVYEHALHGFSVRADARALAGVLADTRVAYVEEDAVIRPTTTQSSATWNLDRIDQRSLPLNTTYVYNRAGYSVHAYIIDTGVRWTHTQFSGRIGQGYNSTGSGVMDCNGHGTNVAGIVGGTTHGVAKLVTIHPVRVANSTCAMTSSSVIGGVDWVTANRITPAVANMSLGGGGSTAFDTAVNNLINAGVTVVAAAGNDNVDACTSSPARVPAAITVGATESNDARWSASNWGSCLDLFAPGTGIISTGSASDTATSNYSGTSQAAPHVAGVVAQYLAANPTASPATVRNAIVNNASTGKVTNRGTGSPDRLLYTNY